MWQISSCSDNLCTRYLSKLRGFRWQRDWRTSVLKQKSKRQVSTYHVATISNNSAFLLWYVPVWGTSTFFTLQACFSTCSDSYLSVLLISQQCAYTYYWNLRHVASVLVMVALCNKADHYIFALLFLSSIFFYSSPNLSGHRLDVYHTLTHGVALVWI